MAITTLDGCIAGMRPTRFFCKANTPTMTINVWQSLWPLAGIPGAGVYDTTLNGVKLDSGTNASPTPVNGQLPFISPASGNTYISRLLGNSTNPGTLILCDRLWHNGGITITSTGAQSIASPTWGARDINGATSGAEVFLGVEVSAAVGAGTPTLTVSYTNSSGTSGQTGTNIYATIASSAIGKFYPISVAAGDVGVQSVQSLTLSATWTSGTINMVAYRPLAYLELPSGGVPASLDVLTGGMTQLYDGTVPFLIHIPTVTVATGISGALSVTQG